MDIKGNILHKSVQILAHDDDGVTVKNMKMQLKLHLTELKWKRKREFSD